MFFFWHKTRYRILFQKATIGILSSKSEGLPVALLEYGFKIVVTDDVGDVSSVITNHENSFFSPKTQNCFMNH
jgi:hypothetical protein